MGRRLDQCLVEHFNIPSKTKAQEIIKAGAVFFKGRQIQKPGIKIEDKDITKIQISEHEVLKFVSRGGLKLEGALIRLNLNLRGLDVLDVGCSTGGFSHCLLLGGAHRVVGIDVGTDQMAEAVTSFDNYSYFEGFHVEGLFEKGLELLPGPFDLAVADLSFISLHKVIGPILSVLKPEAQILALVKPQFELSPGALNKHGVVRSKEDFKKVEKQIRVTFKEHNIRVLDYFESTLPGKDGNQEFFIYGQIN